MYLRLCATLDAERENTGDNRNIAHCQLIFHAGIAAIFSITDAQCINAGFRTAVAEQSLRTLGEDAALSVDQLQNPIELGLIERLYLHADFLPHEGEEAIVIDIAGPTDAAVDGCR